MARESSLHPQLKRVSGRFFDPYAVEADAGEVLTPFLSEAVLDRDGQVLGRWDD
jgi:hypothetical protein